MTHIMKQINSCLLFVLFSFFSMELDIRGMMTDEAEIVVDRFLDEAVMGRLTQVTIIHGKGTGALRTAVHQLLKRHPYVKAFRLGVFGEGEDGVTVAALK